MGRNIGKRGQKRCPSERHSPARGEQGGEGGRSMVISGSSGRVWEGQDPHHTETRDDLAGPLSRFGFSGNHSDDWWRMPRMEGTVVLESGGAPSSHRREMAGSEQG